MREIKFRAWIKPEHWNETENKGLMTNGLPLGGFDKWWLNLDVPFSENCSLDGEFIAGKQIEIMQFTGFKDKNARKIFDGDILSDWTETDQGKVSSHCQVYFDEKHGQWSLDTSFYQDKSNPSPLWLELNDFEYEITGNIYENPELISNSNSN